MSKIKIAYTEYKDFPEATEFSLSFNRLMYVINLFAVFGVIACFCYKWYVGLLGIAGYIILFLLLRKYENGRVEMIIQQEQTKQAEQADYYKLMEWQSRWRDSKELLKLSENSETIRSLAKEQGLTPKQFLEIQQMAVENYEAYHRLYNEKHEKKVPFPSFD